MRNYTEKRASRRIPVECQVLFKLKGAKELHHGRSQNLSVSGIAFKSDVSVAPGDQLELQLLPPQGSSISPLDAFVRVIRSTQREFECEIAAVITEVMS